MKFLKSALLVLSLTVILGSISNHVFAANIAVFDPQTAILGTNVAKSRIDKLKKRSDYKKMESQLKGYEADIKSLQKEAKKKELTWSNDQKQKHVKKVDYIRADYELTYKKINAEQSDLIKQLMIEYQAKLQAASKKVIEKEKIDLLLKPQSVLFAKPTMDITAKVVAELNKSK